METDTAVLPVEEPVDKPMSNDPLAVTMDCYRSALRAVGKSAAQAGYALGS